MEQTVPIPPDHHSHDDEPEPIEPRLDTFVEPAAYLTRDIPPVGGRLRERPEDFYVEELPLYEPCGQGEHIYLFIEKRDLSAAQMIRVLARHFGVSEASIGVAGLKDKRAVTRQLVSIHTPGKTAKDFPFFEHPRMAVLWSDLHTNKLRQGHLAGNRFVIRVRGVDATRVVFAHRVLQRLAAVGVPNRAGEQRFGHMGNNHLIARHWVRAEYDEAVRELLGPKADRTDAQQEARLLFAQGEYAQAIDALPRGAETERRVLRSLARTKTGRRALYAVSHLQRRFYISALQSAVFNAVLDRRATDGTLGTLLEGDLAYKHDNGAVFRVDAGVLADPGTAARLEKLEVSPSGPMWGLEMMEAGGAIGELERGALEAAGVTIEHLREFGRLYKDDIPGKRRALRVPLAFPDAEGGTDEHGHYVRCVFELPAGSFATVVMREIMKPDLAATPA